jgi:hypothetical protein
MFRINAQDAHPSIRDISQVLYGVSAELLGMHADGLAYRLIARNVGLSKNTVMEIVSGTPASPEIAEISVRRQRLAHPQTDHSLRSGPCRETGNHLPRQKPRKIRSRWPVLTRLGVSSASEVVRSYASRRGRITPSKARTTSSGIS